MIYGKYGLCYGYWCQHLIIKLINYFGHSALIKSNKGLPFYKATYFTIAIWLGKLW